MTISIIFLFPFILCYYQILSHWKVGISGLGGPQGLLLGWTGPQSKELGNHNGVNQGIQPPLLPPGSAQWKHLKGKHTHTLCSGAPLHPPSLGRPRSQHHGPGQRPAEAFTGIRLALEHGCRCRHFRACVGCGICLLGWEEDFAWRREFS